MPSVTLVKIYKSIPTISYTPNWPSTYFDLSKSQFLIVLKYLLWTKTIEYLSLFSLMERQLEKARVSLSLKIPLFNMQKRAYQSFRRSVENWKAKNASNSWNFMFFLWPRKLGGVKSKKFSMKLGVHSFIEASNFALSESEVHLNLEHCHRLSFNFAKNGFSFYSWNFECFSQADWRISSYLCYWSNWPSFLSLLHTLAF